MNYTHLEYYLNVKLTCDTKDPCYFRASVNKILLVEILNYLDST